MQPALFPWATYRSSFQLSEQEVSIAVQQKQASLLGCRHQGMAAIGFKAVSGAGCAQHIVTHPNLKQVT